jgi:hypothetical protein
VNISYLVELQIFYFQNIFIPIHAVFDLKEKYQETNTNNQVNKDITHLQTTATTPTSK